MRIAAVQFNINHKDRPSNWDRIAHFIDEAAEKKVDLLVFPEYVLLFSL